MSSKIPSYRPADLIQGRRDAVQRAEPQMAPAPALMTQAEVSIGDLLRPKADPDSFILHIDQVAPRPQPRTTFDDDYITELAADILANGQTDPIIVEPMGGNRYGIVAGECRYRAIKLNGGDTLRATLRRFDEDEIQRSLVQIASNEQRRNFTKLELAQAYTQLQEKTGWTDEQLAQRLNKNRYYVLRVKSLLVAPQEVKDAILSGRESFHNWVNHRDEVLKNAQTGQYMVPVSLSTEIKKLKKDDSSRIDPMFSLPLSVGVKLLEVLSEHARTRDIPFDIPDDPTRKQLSQIVATYVNRVRGDA